MEYIVYSRYTGEIYFTGAESDCEEYLHNYEECLNEPDIIPLEDYK